MNFTCPYCNHPTTITNPNLYRNWQKVQINDSTKGKIGISIFAITCPNATCRNLYLKINLTNVERSSKTSWEDGPTNILQTWQLLPESSAKVLPDYIPEVIMNDYYEACRIKALSPKASATLARRCLQGMIRDFWSVSKSRLKDEIDAIVGMVDPLTWEAIDSVRRVGNIGAHMEKDINLLIDVDPEEAQLLIEQLVEDWYVEKHNKEERLKKIKKIAEEKNEEKLKKGVKNNESRRDLLS